MKVGDRVKVVKDTLPSHTKGLTGTIVDTLNPTISFNFEVLVRFDPPNGWQYGELGYRKEELELIPDEVVG